MEDELAYDEPPAWMVPVRQTLAALLTEQKKYAQAKTYAEEDLIKWPHNVWSSVTLNTCLKRLGQNLIDIEFILENATIKVNTSCACATSSWEQS